MNGKLILVIGVHIVLVYGQPIFTPMAGHVGGHVGPVPGPFGLPIDTLGAASGYAGGGAGFPLLSPMELNAIMEAQARGGFKAAFTPDTEPQGYAGFGGSPSAGHNSFMPNFEEGFGGEGNSEFYEAPHHGEPFPAHEADVEAKQPEPKGRDNRGPYHKDGGAEEGPSSDGPQEPKEAAGRGRGGESETSNGHPRQRGGYRDEDRESGEPNYQNEPASGGAYREHRGEGGPSSGGSSGQSEGAEGPEGPDGPGGPEPYAGGPGGDNYRDDGPPENFRDNAGAFQEDRDYGGPNDSSSGYEPKSEGPESRPSGKQATSGGYTPSGNRRPVMSGDAAGGYSPAVYQDDPRSGGAYRALPNAGYFPGRTGGSTPQGYPASPMTGGRANQPDYSGYKVITALFFYILYIVITLTGWERQYTSQKSSIVYPINTKSYIYHSQLIDVLK